MKSIKEKSTHSKEQNSKFSSERFNHDPEEVDWSNILANANNDMNNKFSSAINLLNRVIKNLHLLGTTISYPKEVKTPYISGNDARYKLFWNKIRIKII